MLYQIGLVLILVALALIIGKKIRNKQDNTEQLIYEDDMEEDELKDLDDKIN